VAETTIWPRLPVWRRMVIRATVHAVGYQLVAAGMLIMAGGHDQQAVWTTATCSAGHRSAMRDEVTYGRALTF
jgi:hypothetical protein